MLHVLFRLGDDAYAISAEAVQEILPLVEIQELGDTPAWVAGVIIRHGKMMPVVDLVQYMRGHPAELLISTRILVLEVQRADERTVRIGAIVERLTDTLMRDPTEFKQSGIRRATGGRIGQLAMDQGRLVQRVGLPDLITEEVRDAILALPVAA